MRRDFNQRSSAGDGAASKRVFKGGKPNRDGFRRKDRDGFKANDRDGYKAANDRDGFRRNDRDGFRRSDREGFRRNDREGFRKDGEGFRKNGFRKETSGRFSDKPAFEKKEFRGERRKFGADNERGAGYFKKGREEKRFIRFENKKRPEYSEHISSPQQSDEIRLNKFISNSGICSRREADEYIQAGLVTVNGTTITELGVKVKPTDDVRFNGERLRGEKKVYIVMNKPKDFVTTTSDPHAEKTVMELLKGCKERVFPVGRLDKSTTGVLMFTNDGRIAEMLTHPSFQKKKIYQVTLDKKLTAADFNKILEGIWLPDGEIAADEMSYVDNDHSVVGIEIHSGRNRIVRRIFESLGYKVKKLDRVYFAGLTKKNLRRGEWRYLTEGEVNALMMGAYE